MNNIENLKNELLYINTQIMAETIYKAAFDMDFNDYDETAENDIKQIEEALYNIKVYCENECNPDYWRYLFLALAKMSGEAWNL